MRKVKLEGWVIFDENELQYGQDMASQVEHELYNVEGVREWSFKEISNEEIECEEEE